MNCTDPYGNNNAVSHQTMQWGGGGGGAVMDVGRLWYISGTEVGVGVEGWGLEGAK